VVQRVGRGIAILFNDLGTRRGEWSAARPGRTFTPGKDQVPIVQKARWASGPVWTVGENLAPTGIRFPNRPARSSVTIPTKLPGTPNLKWTKPELFPEIDTNIGKPYLELCEVLIPGFIVA
jgi:hypothetical protein